MLLGLGLSNLFTATKSVLRIREEQLLVHSINVMYRGSGIPDDLMTQDSDPNEPAKPVVIKWLARVYPRLA